MSEPAPLIQLDHVAKRFGPEHGVQVLALADVSLRVQRGEFVALLGPSGCGKSTVLRLVAGLDQPSAGQVQAPALQADQHRPSKPASAPGHNTAFVFQEPTLMPWASVFDNVWLPLRLQGQSRAQATAAVRAVLTRVGLAEFESAHPAQLSGGMKMRASIARALVTRPQVLLMDEPFAALDDITRHALNADLLRWWRPPQASAEPALDADPTASKGQPAMSALFVTHSVAEAVFLSQRVLVMAARPGRVVAELAIHQPYPREASFRHSPAYHEACAWLGQALLGAHAAMLKSAPNPARDNRAPQRPAPADGRATDHTA
jgi:NitT/TauT family transport system ATP-binding protein